MGGRDQSGREEFEIRVTAEPAPDAELRLQRIRELLMRAAMRSLGSDATQEEGEQVEDHV